MFDGSSPESSGGICVSLVQVLGTSSGTIGGIVSTQSLGSSSSSISSFAITVLDPSSNSP